MTKARGFTLVELLVAFVLATLALSLLLSFQSCFTRSRNHSSNIIDTLEGAIKLLDELEKDLAQMVAISGKPVVGYVLRLSQDHRSLVLRTGGKVVTYQCRSKDSYSLERQCEQTSIRVNDLASVRFDCSALCRDQLLLRVRVLVGVKRRLPLERLFRIPIPFGQSGKEKPLAFEGTEL